MTRTLLSGLVIGAVVGLGLTLGCQPVETVTVETIAPTEPDAGPVAAVPPEDLKALVEANNNFAIELYKKLAETEKGNIFFSPYSIHAALSMTYAGARGETAAQMAKVLGIEKLGDRVHPAHAELARKLKSDGGKDKPEFHVANALWGQKGLEFRPEFLDLTKRHYGGGFGELDFRGDRFGSLDTINKWVSDQMREKIPKLIDEEDLPSGTKLVLTNAVYFKGMWAEPFAKKQTIDDKFWLAPDKSMTVPMIRRSATSGYFAGDGMKMVLLAYQGKKQSMAVIVPDDIDGLPVVERKLFGGQLRQWLEGRSVAEVNLLMPKFQVKMHLDIVGYLKALGMRRPFETGADFSAISDRAELGFNKVIHGAVAEVDEEGTVAAAATAIVMRAQGSAKPPRPVTIRADRPFLILILDNELRKVVFAGRVINPDVMRVDSRAP